MYYSMAEMSVAEMSVGRNVRGRNVRGRKVLAETSVAEMSEHRRYIEIILIRTFKSSSHFLWLRSPDCFGPGRKPRRLVFSRRKSYLNLQYFYKLCTKTQQREMMKMTSQLKTVKTKSEKSNKQYDLYSCIDE